MSIEKYDKNFIVKTEITEPDIIWLQIRQAPFGIEGVFYDENQRRYLRIPQEVAEKVSAGVMELNTNTAGGRVRFRTNSTFIGIHSVQENNCPMPHMTLAGQSGFDLYRKTEGDEIEGYVQTFLPPWKGMKNGYSSSCETDGKMADYTINFPLYDGVKELYIALKKDAVLLEATPYRCQTPIVYYGSSITQGGCASRPGNSYEAILSRRFDANYVNLGFSGNGKAEPAMRKYLAGLEMSVFVCDYDYNATDAEYLRKTHLPLYREIRSAHPKMPIIIVSAPTILLQKEKFSKRRKVIEETCQIAWREGDKNLYFVDGAELFKGDDWDSCTVDGCHPNDLGFYRMAKRISREFEKFI